MNIILFGYRGSGKSTVGRLVAQQLGHSFFDTDDEVCELLGAANIADAWYAHGELIWRKTECRVVADLVRSDGQVISLGGGTLIQDAARLAVERCRRCLRFYLQCDAAELFHRIKADPKFSDTRPNLPELGASVHRIRLMLTQRDPVYRQVADHIIDVTGQTPDQTAEQVLAFVR